MTNSTQTEWVNVTSKPKKSKNKQTFKIHKNNKPRFNFDSDESQTKHNTTVKVTTTEFPEISSSKKKTGGSFFDFNDGSKKQDSWAVKLKLSVETPKTVAPIKPTKPDPKHAIYLYDWEVDKLCRTMKWGDFEVMMDDVIIIPDNQPKPTKK